MSSGRPPQSSSGGDVASKTRYDPHEHDDDDILGYGDDILGYGDDILGCDDILDYIWWGGRIKDQILLR